MRLSTKILTAMLKLSPASIIPKLPGLHMAAVALAACTVSVAHADATLSYELSEGESGKTEKQFSMARFFVRIDDPAEKDRYLLFQAGKFFPLFSVDQAKGTYTRLTSEVTPYMSPQSRKHHGADETGEQGAAKQTSENREKPAPPLKPTKKTRKVAGIECRVVHQLQDDKPIIEHCMANSARLGITEREVITMARTLEMARNRDFGWLGIGSRDESFISIQSKDLRDNRMLTLKAVSNKPLAQGYLRIPREYTEVEPKDDQKAAVETKTEPEPE